MSAQHTPTMLMFHANACADERAWGWAARLRDALPDVRVLYTHKPFGRSLYLIKAEGAVVSFLQDPNAQIKNGIDAPSAPQLALIETLRAAGAIAKATGAAS